jgi:hypothetical protein
VGIYVESIVLGNEKSHAHGPVDDSSTNSTGDREPQETITEIKGREQVDMGHIYSDGSTSIQDAVDPNGLGISLERKADGNETAPRPPPPVETVTEVKIEKPKKGQSLLIIKRTSLHKPDDTGSEGGNSERAGGESGLAEGVIGEDKTLNRKPNTTHERIQEAERVESEEYSPDKGNRVGDGEDTPEYDLLRIPAIKNLGEVTDWMWTNDVTPKAFREMFEKESHLTPPMITQPRTQITEKLSRDFAKRAAWMIQGLRKTELLNEEHHILEANLLLLLDWNQRKLPLTRVIARTVGEIMQILESSEDQLIKDQREMVYWMWTVDPMMTQETLEKEP